MALSIDQFINEVAASGLVPAAELLTWLSAIPETQRPKSGEELARELVQQKKLTQFQAEQIYAGQGKSLTLGNYLILDKLGQGGMGLVLKAMHLRMERIVALKVMSQAGMRSPDAVQRFHREVKAAAKLNHPNIVTAYDADESNGTHFLVMEYVEGANLSALVKECGPLPAEQAVQCILQAARGLEYAHSRGVIHRDIKPSNLLLIRETRDERREGGETPASRLSTLVSHPLLKILDMGLARIDEGANAQAELTTTGAVMGTVDYMAPEQALSAKSADARSDIYSLGITLWYLLTGRVAYDGDSLMAKLLAHRDSAIPSLAEHLRVESQESRERSEDNPLDSPLSALDSVFRRMVAKRPADRYQSMTEVILDLERCLAGTGPMTASRPIKGNHSSQTSPSGTTVGSLGTALSQSAAEAETVMLSAGGAGADLRTEQSLTLAGSRLQSPAAGRTSKRRLAQFGSLATGVLLLLAIVFSRSNQPDQRVGLNESTHNDHREITDGTAAEVGSLWTDWLGPKLKRGDFIGNRDGWLVEGDSITTDRVIQGIEVLPVGTRDAAIRVTYLLRDSRGIQLSGRENKTGETLDFSYFAEDNGEKIQIATMSKKDAYKNLAAQAVSADIEKTAPRTLEFRLLGETLTLTLNGSVVLTVKDSARSEGLFALAALKGVLIQKVEYQKLDELASKTTAMSERANASICAKAPFTAMQARTHQEAWAKHLGTTVETENTVGAKMVIIPPGEFLMGSSDEQITAAAKEMEESTARQTVIDHIQKSERPQHRVMITKPFLMGATEVTLGQFKKFIAATERQTTGEKQATDASSRTYLRPGYPVTDDSPVSVVTWDEATAYCNWLSDREQAVYRLPTEAEWEYACRAGTESLWSWGDGRTQSIRYAWTIKNSELRSHPVATKLPNPFGLFDLHGNVSEWCQDRFDESWYGKSPPDDPIGSGPNAHTLSVRGGSWDYNSIERSAYRTGFTHHICDYTIGFRVVREIEFSKEQASPDRRAAEWVIAQGGRVRLKDRSGEISTVADLPQSDFKVLQVNLNKQRLSGSHADLVPLRGLQQVVFIGLDASNVSAEGLVGLASIPSLERISVGGGASPLGDDRVAAISKIKTLQKAFLVNAKLTPAQCAILAENMPQAIAFDFTENSLLNDAAIEPLGQLSKLESLQLNRTQVTASGVAALQKSLPNCKIQWDGTGQ